MMDTAQWDKSIKNIINRQTYSSLFTHPVQKRSIESKNFLVVCLTFAFQEIKIFSFFKEAFVVTLYHFGQLRVWSFVQIIFKKGAFFSGLWGYFPRLTKRLKISFCLFNKNVIRGAPWHFLLTKFFKKNLKFFFESKGSPLWILKKSKKIEKNRKNFQIFFEKFC